MRTGYPQEVACRLGNSIVKKCNSIVNFNEPKMLSPSGMELEVKFKPERSRVVPSGHRALKTRNLADSETGSCMSAKIIAAMILAPNLQHPVTPPGLRRCAGRPLDHTALRVTGSQPAQGPNVTNSSNLRPLTRCR